MISKATCKSFFLPRHASTLALSFLFCVILYLTFTNNHPNSTMRGELQYFPNIPVLMSRIKMYRSNRLLDLLNRNNSLAIPERLKHEIQVDAESKWFPPLPLCQLPKMNVSEHFMIGKIKRPKRPSCEFGHPSWISVVNGTITFSEVVISEIGNFTCDLTPLLRNDDDETVKWGELVLNIPNGFHVPVDIFGLECRAKSHDIGQNARRYSQIFHGISEKQKHKYKPLQPLRLNSENVSVRNANTSVLILGFSSMSRMSWLRRMPKTSSYFLNTLNAIELKGYHAMGDTPTAAIFPMLTGMSEEEIVQSMNTDNGQLRTLNELPWLWKEFARAGYITSLADSDSEIPIWRGKKTLYSFKDQPTHYFLRPFYLGLKASGRKAESVKDFCLGDVPKHIDWLNWARDMFYMHGDWPKFMFHFYSSLSLYNNNDIMLADDDLQSFLANLRLHDYLDNTIVILTSDHGSSVADVTSSWHGRLEERLPFLAISFPTWFHKQHPELVQNMKTNADRLTTPFDIYETLKALINPSHLNVTSSFSPPARGISLFKQMDKERTCSQANVSSDWCACLERIHISANHEKARRAALEVMEIINLLTSNERSSCTELKPENIQLQSAERLTSNKNMIGFGKTPNRPDSQTDIELEYHFLPLQEDYYRVRFTTQPGHSEFEVLITHRINEDSMHVELSDVIRLDKNIADPCVHSINRKLRPFCICI